MRVLETTARALQRRPDAARLARIAALLQRPACPAQRFKASTARPEEHDAAMRQHQDDRMALVAEVRRMARSSDPLEGNTARWLMNRRSQLFALTLTADHEERALALGKSPELAMFGAARSVFDETTGGYNTRDMEDESGIKFVPAASGGFRLPSGGNVYITQPSRREELNRVLQAADGGRFDPIAESLKHEVQHEADVDFDMESMAHDASDLALAEYRTEFRAYTAQSPRWLAEPLTPRQQEQLAGLGLDSYSWADDVQPRIFLQIVRNYPRVAEAWAADRMLSDGRKFRDAVLSVSGPIHAISANPTNSPEVGRLWEMITGATFGDVGKAQPLVEAARAVSEGDRKRMLDARDLWKSRLGNEPWKEAELRALLSDDPTFGAARAAAEQEKHAGRPPLDLFMQRCGSWEAVKQLIDANGLVSNENVMAEFDDWSRHPFDREMVDAFLGNTSVGDNGVSWETVLRA